MKTLLALLAMSLPLAASAQYVWRCGPDGRSYTDMPCGEGRTVVVADARSDADIAAARQVADRERRLAEQLRLERLRREAQPVQRAAIDLAPPRPVVVITTVVPKWPAKPKKRHPPEAPDTWRAVAPASRQTKG